MWKGLIKTKHCDGRREGLDAMWFQPSAEKFAKVIAIVVAAILNWDLTADIFWIKDISTLKENWHGFVRYPDNRLVSSYCVPYNTGWSRNRLKIENKKLLAFYRMRGQSVSMETALKTALGIERLASGCEYGALTVRLVWITSTTREPSFQDWLSYDWAGLQCIRLHLEMQFVRWRHSLGCHWLKTFHSFWSNRRFILRYYNSTR